jgi:hypothetical protein
MQLTQNLNRLNAALDEWHSESIIRQDLVMKEIIKLIPMKYRRWYFFGLFFAVMGQIVSFAVSLASGKTFALQAVFASNFSAYYSLGELYGQLMGWFVGGLWVYWWEIGRKKE